MQKTLGGNRLGSGKKMKVDLQNFERSTHDLGYIWRSTMSAGTLVPFLNEIALPGDTFDIDLDCDIKTHPTIGPLFGSYKVQLDVFSTPIRLYNSWLHNNMLNIGRDMSQVKIPQIEMTAQYVADLTVIQDLDNFQINPSSLLAYIGIRGIGINQDVSEEDHTRLFNALGILCYWDQYKNYYANKEELNGVVIHTPAEALVSISDVQILDPDNTPHTIALAPALSLWQAQNGSVLQINFGGGEPPPSQIFINTIEHGWINGEEIGLNWFLAAAGILRGQYNFTKFGETRITQWRNKTAQELSNLKPALATFVLGNIDEMRQEILAASGGLTFKINAPALVPYQYLYGITNDIPNILSSQEGLAIKTYQSDLFNNWLKTENIEAITTATAIDTTGGSFTIDQLSFNKKLYNMYNAINASGGTYDDWLDAVYAHERYLRAETPMYMGGLIKELVFQEVVSNSESESGQPLGTLAGKGILAKKHKGGKIVIKVDEPSYIQGIISLTPRIDYSQGNKWHVHLKTLDDLHKPYLDQIGFQDLVTEQMAAWDTHWDGAGWLQASAGKQPAWINYMTNVNETRGNFAIANNEMFMTLNRRYEVDPEDDNIIDLTTYIDPSKFNYIFAETALDAQNFWAQIAVDITARRKMSAKTMPRV